MNPGTFYLYEYENGRRTRNVGFIKVNRHYRSCILQLHARGIPVGNGACVQLWAFFRDDDDSLIAEQIAVLNCFGRSISARLPVSENRFPEGRPLSQIDGFIIRLPGKSTSMFWMASAFFFDVDIQKIKTASSAPKNTPAEAVAAETDDSRTRNTADTFSARSCPSQSPADEEASAQVSDPSDGDEAPAQVSDPSDGDEAPAQVSDSSADAETPAQVSDSSDGDEAPAQVSDLSDGDDAPAQVSDSSDDEKMSSETPDSPARPSARKISRSDMSQLPRRFWPLANNSFLLHGYHNYGHLLLIEEDARLWLGVPGTYAPQEARAADLFGFPRFTRSYAGSPELTAEERTDNADFGHWCRCVGNVHPH